MADPRVWPAVLIRSHDVVDESEADLVAACLDDYSPTALHDMAAVPLPPDGLWDPTYPPLPAAPPAPLQWRVFFTNAAQRDAARQAVATAFPLFAVDTEDVADEDWAARSQRELTAVSAGDFIIAPPWDIPLRSDATVVVINPSRGFGTGHHASTRVCLQALSSIELIGSRVLDVGTGSGVLAMAAILKGARDVLAVDIDPEAIDSARESARLNARVERIHWLIADFRTQGWDTLAGGPWPLVLANLTAGMLTASATRLRALLRTDGRLICSGFDEGARDSVVHALQLPVLAEFCEDRWVALILAG